MYPFSYNANNVRKSGEHGGQVGGAGSKTGQEGKWELLCTHNMLSDRRGARRISCSVHA